MTSSLHGDTRLPVTAVADGCRAAIDAESTGRHVAATATN
jgi:hypothetical protein